MWIFRRSREICWELRGNCCWVFTKVARRCKTLWCGLVFKVAKQSSLWCNKAALLETKIATRWWLLKYVLFSPRNLGEMIQFDEHIFQLGWFNHQLATTSSAACLDIFVRFRSPWHRPRTDTQTGPDFWCGWKLGEWGTPEILFGKCRKIWNFTSLSDHQYQYLFPEPPELCAWKILPDFCSLIFENQFSKKKRMKL